MGGLFGVVSKKKCVTELFYGVDYHSHLGTKRGGMAMVNQDGQMVRCIHSLKQSYFRVKFEPELRKFETGTVDSQKLVPYRKDGLAAGVQKVAGYRGPFTFLQYVQTPGEYKMHFEAQQIGKYAGISVEVEVFDANGTAHDAFTITKEKFDYVLKAQSKNSMYRFDVRPNGRRVLMSSELPGQGIVANDRVHWLTGADQNIYFQAKAGAGDVKVELTMSPGEWVSAELIDPSGNVVDRCERRDAGVILVGTRAKDAPAGIWSLHVTTFVDDCRLRLGAATSGVYAYDRELVLVEE